MPWIVVDSLLDKIALAEEDVSGNAAEGNFDTYQNWGDVPGGVSCCSR